MHAKMLSKFCLLLLVTTCFIVNVMSKEISATSPMVPYVSVQPTVVVSPGENASLSCIIASFGQSPFKARWVRNDTTLAEMSFTDNSSESHILMLPLPDVLPEDVGTYKCVVESEAGNSSVSTRLFIYSKPIIQVAKKKIEYATPKANLTLHCLAAAYPAPTWKWYFNGSFVNETLMKIKPIGNGGSELEIMELTDEFYGNYTCEADNPYGSDSYTLTLMKLVTPPKPLLACHANNKNAIKCEDMNEKGKLVQVDSPQRYMVYMLEDIDGVNECCKSNKTLMDCNSIPTFFPNNEGDIWIHGRKPDTKYILQAVGINDAGVSEIGECVVVDIETTKVNHIVWIVIFGIIMALIVMDVICCLLARKGLTAWAYRKIHRNPRREHRFRIADLESNRSSGFGANVVLLKSTQRNV